MYRLCDLTAKAGGTAVVSVLDVVAMHSAARSFSCGIVEFVRPAAVVVFGSFAFVGEDTRALALGAWTSPVACDLDGDTALAALRIVSFGVDTTHEQRGPVAVTAGARSACGTRRLTQRVPCPLPEGAGAHEGVERTRKLASCAKATQRIRCPRTKRKAVLRSRIVIVALWSSIALAATSCKKHEAESSGPVKAGAGPSLLSSVGLDKAMSALRARLGAHAKLLQLLVFPGHVQVQAQDPKHPGKVVQYEYRNGKVGAAQSVSLESTDSLEESLYSIDDIKVDVIPDLAKRAVHELAHPGGEVSYVVLKRNLPFETEVQYRVFVKNASKDAYVDADKDGKLIVNE